MQADGLDLTGAALEAEVRVHFNVVCYYVICYCIMGPSWNPVVSLSLGHTVSSWIGFSVLGMAFILCSA